MPKVVQKCRACEGRKVSSKGKECVPCEGTGVQGGKRKVNTNTEAPARKAAIVDKTAGGSLWS